MSHSSLMHSALTGRLAADVGTEVLLALLTVGLVGGLSVARLDGVWAWAVPVAAAVYSAVRIGLVVRRTRDRGRED